MIKYIEGNLFEADQDVIAHGCNCKGGFGSGVAGQIAKLYPEVRQAYLKKHNSEGWKLGDIQVVSTYMSFDFVNCATQKEYGNAASTGHTYCDYSAIETCMLKLYKHCKENGLTLAMPKIGAGLAGGDWNRISQIINHVFDDMDVHVYYL